jgi:hypothetical protein
MDLLWVHIDCQSSAKYKQIIVLETLVVPESPVGAGHE